MLFADFWEYFLIVWQKYSISYAPFPMQKNWVFWTRNLHELLKLFPNKSSINIK